MAGDSDLVELFQCPRTSSSRYRLALMKLSLKPLAQSQKVSLRTDARGFLCLQYMIKTDDGHICFVEFFVSGRADFGCAGCLDPENCAAAYQVNGCCS